MGGTGRERAQQVGIVVAGAAVLAAVTWVVFLGDGSEGATAGPTPPPSAVAPPTTQRPGADEVAQAIDVVDAGLTAGHVYACVTAAGQATGWYPPAGSCPPERRGPIGDTVSYGVVVRNTSDQVVQDVPLTLRFLDDAGQVINEPATPFSDVDLTSVDAGVAILRPGETFGFGGMRYLDRPGATRVDVEVGEPREWMPADHFDWLQTCCVLGSRTHTSLRLTASDIRVSTGPENEPVVTFQVSTNIDQPVSPPYANAVFRNAAGEVIGGADGPVESEIPPEGSSVQSEIRLDDPMAVPGIDPTRTEIYFSGP